MSSRELTSDGSEYSQVSPDSNLGSQDSFQIQGKPKRMDKNYMCWKFRDTIQAEFSEDSFHESKLKLHEHLRSRTSLEQPLCIRSITIFADLHQLLHENTHGIRTISITVIGYVQTKTSREYTMKNPSTKPVGHDHAWIEIS